MQVWIIIMLQKPEHTTNVQLIFQLQIIAGFKPIKLRGHGYYQNRKIILILSPPRQLSTFKKEISGCRLDNC